MFEKNMTFEKIELNISVLLVLIHVKQGLSGFNKKVVYNKKLIKYFILWQV